MSSRSNRAAVLLAASALAVVVVPGCGQTQDGPSTPVTQRDRVATPDAPDTGGHGSGDASALVAEAVTAWETNDPTTFVARIGQASDACADPEAGRRLSEVAIIAERWSSALADGRPKVQATTETQLAAIDWQDLAAACA